MWVSDIWGFLKITYMERLNLETVETDLATNPIMFCERMKVFFKICKIPNSLPIPLPQLLIVEYFKLKT